MLICCSCRSLFTKEPGKKGPQPRYCSSECALQARGRRVQTHGHNGYKSGCRCDVCKSGARDGMRAYYQAVGGNKNRNPEVERAWLERVGSSRKRYPEMYRAHDLLRRARKATPDAERFDSHEVFERDEWLCGICDEAVDPALRYPDPGSASLDHIVPLSRGGSHTRANTQCAHLSCNIKKGAQVAA